MPTKPILALIVIPSLIFFSDPAYAGNNSHRAWNPFKSLRGCIALVAFFAVPFYGGYLYKHEGEREQQLKSELAGDPRRDLSRSPIQKLTDNQFRQSLFQSNLEDIHNEFLPVWIAVAISVGDTHFLESELRRPPITANYSPSEVYSFYADLDSYVYARDQYSDWRKTRLEFKTPELENRIALAHELTEKIFRSYLEDSKNNRIPPDLEMSAEEYIMNYRNSVSLPLLSRITNSQNLNMDISAYIADLDKKLKSHLEENTSSEGFNHQYYDPLGQIVIDRVYAHSPNAIEGLRRALASEMERADYVRPAMGAPKQLLELIQDKIQFKINLDFRYRSGDCYTLNFHYMPDLTAEAFARFARKQKNISLDATLNAFAEQLARDGAQR